MKKLILTIILCLFTAIAVAEEKEDRIENLPGVWWEKIQALNRSFGRTGGKPDGEIVYVVTYWVNVYNNMSMASVQVPGAQYSCVLYRTFDLEINPYFNWEERIDT
jgi:hypothetical protein